MNTIHVSYAYHVDLPITLSVPSLLKRWKRLETGLELSANTFNALSKHFGEKTNQWLVTENHAQMSRHEDLSLMDIYDTVTRQSTDGMNIEYLIFHMLMNVPSSLSCKRSATADFRGEWRFIHPWSDILDCIWYEDSRASVSEYICMYVLSCC